MEPTDYYWKVIEDGKHHHMHARTWSGGLATRHAARIKAMIDRIGAKSILDYGSGKGIQYAGAAHDGKRLEDYWGVPVFKFDPAVPPNWRESRIGRVKFADMPHDIKVHTVLPEDGEWDMLVCTHVLGCIPVVDLEGWVVPLLHRVIKKGFYFAENMGQATKRVVKDKESKKALKRQWTPDDWVKAVTPPDDREVEFWFRGHDPERLGARFEKWPFNGAV